MIPFRQRFHGHGGVRYVLKNGRASRSRLFTVKAVKGNRKTGRTAVVVSKKVYKGAVGRNRMRRRIYEIIRQELPEFGGSYDVAVLLSSAEIIHTPHDELKTTLQNHFRELGLYK